MKLSRRTVLAAIAGSIAAPSIGGAASRKTLRYLPRYDPSILDPHWTTSSGTRNHAYLVYDTLYGLDELQNPQPQMVEGHTLENGDRTWTLSLREGLKWHDGETVLARDCVSSLRRWAKRDGIGQSLLAVTDEIVALDDRKIQFRLKKQYPFFLYSLAKSAGSAPFMMPERLAESAPSKPVTELIGSGPFKFNMNEYVPGNSLVYDKFEGYKPRSEGKVSGSAGPKRVFVDRVEWNIIPDVSTALSTLQTGGADWIELVPPELMSLVSGKKDIQVRILDRNGFVGVFRPNHLQPPFNNPDVRRAILGAINQEELMQSFVGDDPGLRQVPCGFFAPGMPMASDEGLSNFTSPRDYDRVKRDLAAAGYKGEKMALLAAVDLPQYSAVCETLADQLKKGGMNVDLQSVDWGTLVKRRISREPVEKGGWSAFVTLGFYSSETFLNPFTNVAIRGNGADAWPGWPTSPRLEELRSDWMTATTESEQKRLAAAIQGQAFLDVPYVPMGLLRQYTAYNRKFEGIIDGIPTFWNVKQSS